MNDDAIRYVIKNPDGRYGAEFAFGKKFHFGTFNPPITTLYRGIAEARMVIAEQVKQGIYKEGELKIVKFGEIEEV